jgi:heme iron utilization protein
MRVFADFGFWRMEIRGGHLVAGFGRIADVMKDDLLITVGDARSLAAVETDAVAHMNEDHREAIALYATRLLDEEAGDWRMATLDPDGCDLMCNARTRRLEFPQRVTDAEALRRVLAKLAEEARKRGSGF